MAHDKYDDCIEACDACAVECEHCLTACLDEKPVEPLVRCIRLDRDCADLCRLAAALMSRDSSFAREVCLLCATTCDACAAECERHDMDHCRRCASACRSCAAECREMAAA
jgi:hypothetical protein